MNAKIRFRRKFPSKCNKPIVKWYKPHGAIQLDGGTGRGGLNNGYETVAITRKMSMPYEDIPAWQKVKRVLIDREKDTDFINFLKEMAPDIIVDLVIGGKTWRSIKFDFRQKICPKV